MTAPGRYDPVAQATHWLVAALAIAVATLGLMIPEAPRGSGWRDGILLWHRSIGMTILLAMVLRAVWRLSHPPPPLPDSLRPIEAFLAHATHFLLYVAFLGMPLAGYVNTAAAGHSVSFFGLFSIPPVIAPNPRLAQIAIALHLAGQFAVYGLVAAHVAAALMHGIVRRDGVFSRMLPARRY
ncbi:MAG TPA: cytochrome b [Stellaceae bacterium]|nr:cytochrome b [Stellaceae bacterium]